MHGLNLIANCSSSSKKWQMTLVRQNNDRMYVAVWSAKFIWLVMIEILDRKSMINGWDLLSVLHDSWWNCSRLLSCQCYILIKNCCDNWCVRSLAEMEPVCSLPSSHKLHFFNYRSGECKTWQLVWYSSVPPVSWPLPLCTLAYTPSSSPVQGVWTLINRTQAVVFDVRHLVTINS